MTGVGDKIAEIDANRQTCKWGWGEIGEQDQVHLDTGDVIYILPNHIHVGKYVCVVWIQ